jgi:chemotaxis protein histidine kinase CheA
MATRKETRSPAFQVPEDALAELRAEYLRDCEEKLAVIRQQAKNLSSRNGFKTAFPILLFITHQLKGSGGSLGFASISEKAKALHTRLSECLEIGQPQADLQELAKEMAARADDLEAAIRSSKVS